MIKKYLLALLIGFMGSVSAEEVKNVIIVINSESNYEVKGVVYYSIADLERGFSEVDNTYSVTLLPYVDSKTQKLIDLMDFLRKKGIRNISISSIESIPKPY